MLQVVIATVAVLCCFNGIEAGSVQYWRNDGRCGPNYPVNGQPTICNPTGEHPCCSPSGWCGNTDAHCKCSTCTDYRTDNNGGNNNGGNNNGGNNNGGNSGGDVGGVDSAQCVTAHNKLRALHQNTGTMSWDSNLAARAQRWSDENARRDTARQGRMTHEHSAGEGENMYWSMGTAKGDCVDAALSWYSEINDYDYGTAQSKNGKAVGHFTQLVWRASNRVGVGITIVDVGGGYSHTYIVAKYTPQGNFHTSGQRYQDYSYNVQPRKPGARTPAPHEIDPAKCKNADPNCQGYFNSGYDCNHPAIKSSCYKSCNNC